MRIAHLFKQSSIYMTGEFVRRCVGFLMIPLYTRYLTPADYGILEILELFVVLAGVYFGLSAINDGMVRIYHDYADRENQASVVSTAVFAVAGSSLLVAILAAMLATPLASLSFGDGHLAWLIRAIFGATIFSSLTDISLTYLRLRERPGLYVVYSICQLIVNVLLNIYFIAHLRMGLAGFVVAKLVVSTAGSAYLLVLVFRESGFKWRPETAKRIARFAGPLIVSSGSIVIIHFADRFFVNHFGTLSDVGIYALAYKLGFMVSYAVGVPFQSVWQVRLYAHANGPHWHKEFARVLTYLAWFVILAAAVLGVFIDKTIGFIAAPAFRPAAALVPIVAFAYAFREIGDFFKGVLYIDKRVTAFGRITLTCAGLNLAANWVLISRFKAAGAAWATLLTWSVYMVACWVTAHREHRIPYPIRSLVTLCGLGIGVCVAVYPLQTLGTAWQWMAALGLMGIFFAGSWTLGYFSPEERLSIRHAAAAAYTRWLSASAVAGRANSA
jgi:O-antigen/teichoic acid export membrane protein